MADLGSEYTDVEIQRVNRRLREIYQEAANDIDRKMREFNDKYLVKEAIHRKELEEGKITKEQFEAWERGQVFQGRQWQLKKKQIEEVLNNANTIAADLVNGKTHGVFAFNSNFAAYSLETGAGFDFGFGLYDTNTVARLLKEDPSLLPEWKIDEEKDYIWNAKKVQTQITQGVLQGESLDKIANRLASNLSTQNMNRMKTFARTAMTGAQNAGRVARYEEAEELGIKVEKQWMATFDAHTRDSHADLDGEHVPIHIKFSNGCRYPGDPLGRPEEVYNCRCTLVSELLDYPSEYTRIDNISREVIQNMTYSEWAEYKGLKKKKETVIESFQSRLGAAKTVAEVNNLINSQGWWRSINKGSIQLEADLTGCDLDSAKSIAASYDQIFTKYPTLKGQFDPIDAHPVRMKDTTYAWCYASEYSHGKVEVNPRIYSNWDKVVRTYESDVLSGWHPYGTTAESIVTHEVGHAIDILLGQKGILGGRTSSGEFRVASSSLKSTIMKRVAKEDPNLAQLMEFDKRYKTSRAVSRSVSRYAAENPKEWFAECFAEYITSANPRAVAAEFGKELEKLLARLVD